MDVYGASYDAFTRDGRISGERAGIEPEGERRPYREAAVQARVYCIL